MQAMSIDPTVVLFIITVINSVASFLLWLRKPGQDATAAIATFRTAVAETDGVLKGRLDVLEERVRHMPTSDELSQLEGQLGAIKAEMGGMKDLVQSTRSGVNRIEEFLRNSSR